VRHRAWGDGTVMSEDGDRITVLFDSMGYRTLSLASTVENGLLTALADPVGRPDPDPVPGPAPVPPS